MRESDHRSIRWASRRLTREQTEAISCYLVSFVRAAFYRSFGELRSMLCIFYIRIKTA